MLEGRNMHLMHGVFSHIVKVEKCIFFPYEESHGIKIINKVKPLLFN